MEAYHVGTKPDKAEFARTVQGIGQVLKIIMYTLLISADILIIWKIYKMRLIGRRAPRTPVTTKRLAGPTTGTTLTNLSETPSSIQPISQVQRRQKFSFKMSLEKRLVVALLFVALAYQLFPVYFMLLNVLPAEILPYLRLLVYNLEASKCTAYVLIVTLR
ncbi:unnamed protein product, partial [Mesorhabditis spiculigera]